MTYYARGVAHAARLEAPMAIAALDTVRAVLSVTEDPIGKAVLGIASAALAGEIAYRAGDLATAEVRFREAVEGEDGLLYMEPPHWYYPVRHSLGAVLLAQGRAADAEQVYRQDLARFPENTWSLHGLEASLRAQGRAGDADAVRARIGRLGGDLLLMTSRL